MGLCHAHAALDRLDLRLLAALLAGLSIGWVGLLQAATVLSIGDGDTIRVMEGGKPITVRPACIDPLAQQVEPRLKRDAEAANGGP